MMSDSMIVVLPLVFVGVVVAVKLAVFGVELWFDYDEWRKDDRLTDDLSEMLERELAECGAPEGSDGRHA